jgi:uncharacterized protein
MKQDSSGRVKRTIMLATVSAALLAPPCSAQTSTASDVPTRDEVLQFMEVAHVRANMEQMIAGMKEGSRKGAEESFKTEVPNATPDQLKKVDVISDEVFRDFPLQEMIDAIIPIYQKHLTRQDLQGIIAFYSSPAGQKLQKEQPAMMAEGMQAGQQIMLKRIPDINARIHERVRKLIEQENQKPPPKSS